MQWYISDGSRWKTGDGGLVDRDLLCVPTVEYGGVCMVKLCGANGAKGEEEAKGAWEAIECLWEFGQKSAASHTRELLEEGKENRCGLKAMMVGS